MNTAPRGGLAASDSEFVDTTPAPTELERLISRFLDGEATFGERREMNRRVDTHAPTRALLDDYAALDREAGSALRLVMRRGGRPALPLGLRIMRFGALAAAACLATMFFTLPGGNPSGKDDAVGASLFARPTLQDPIAAEKPLMDRPYVRKSDTQRNWIMIPSDRPGEYLLVEVNRTRTRAYGIHADY